MRFAVKVGNIIGHVDSGVLVLLSALGLFGLWIGPVLATVSMVLIICAVHVESSVGEDRQSAVFHSVLMFILVTELIWFPYIVYIYMCTHV